jgi:WD40 repeat protein
MMMITLLMTMMTMIRYCQYCIELCQVWVGTKDGTIFIYDAHSRKLWKSIKAHDDAVRALCAAESRYVMSGAGSKDGKVAVWSPAQHVQDDEDKQHGEMDG